MNVLLFLLVSPTWALEPVVVGLARIEPSPGASTAYEGAEVGIEDTLGAVLTAHGLTLGSRDQSLFPKRDVHDTLLLGGYVRKLSCEGDSPVTCKALVRWEVWDTRAAMVVSRITTHATGDGEANTAAAQASVAMSLEYALRTEAFHAAFPADDALPPPAWKAPFPAQACLAEPLALPRDLNTVLDTVVILESDDGTGSGVLVSPEGLLATAAHVVGKNTTMKVILHDGYVLEARVLRVDQAFDVALLDLPGRGWPCRRLGARDVRLGEEVFVLGAPFGEDLGWTVSRGVVGGVRPLSGRPVIQTDASINPGTSGGPLLDAQGEVLGIASFKLVDVRAEGLGFAIPAREWRERLQVGPAPGDLPNDPSPFAWITRDLGEEGTTAPPSDEEK